jgi:hypothetical protein
VGTFTFFKGAVEAFKDGLFDAGADLAGRAIVAELKEIVGTEGFGQPSPPGHAPFLQTGGLRRAISYTKDRPRRTVLVIVDHPAAFYLEYGTRFMAPRPFLRRGLLGYALKFGGRHFSAGLGARHIPGQLMEAA